MFYPFKVKKQDDGTYLGEMVDIEAITTGQSFDEIADTFRETFSTFFEINYRKKKKAMPLPSEIPDGNTDEVGAVYVPLRLQLRILLWNEIIKRKLSITEFSELMGIPKQLGVRYFNGAPGVSLEKYETAFLKLGCSPNLTIE